MSDTAAGEIVHDPDSRDHFEVLGLPRRLRMDLRQLADHYYRLSRRYHPDFHQMAPPSERVASLRRTAAINDAYATLRDPASRGRWWLERQGGRLGDNPTVPPDLAELVFEVQDALAEYRENGDEALADQVRARRAEVQRVLDARMAALERNFARWDMLPADDASPEARRGLLAELGGILAGISYARTLLRDTDRVLEKAGEARPR